MKRRLDYFSDEAQSITLSTRDSLSIIRSPKAPLSNGGKFLAASILQHGRIFLHEFNSEQGPIPIIDVTYIMNQRVETKLVRMVGKELGRRLIDFGPEIFLTASSSGIMPTFTIAESLANMPFAFAQKGNRATFTGKRVLRKSSFSHTGGDSVDFFVAESSLPRGSRVVIADDFLATGTTIKDLLEIARLAGCEVVAVATFIEKSFEGGRQRLIEEEGFSDNQIISALDITAMERGRMKIKGISPWLSLVVDQTKVGEEGVEPSRP